MALTMDCGNSKRQAFVHVGALLVEIEPCVLTTVLGSCISVCLFAPALRVGGMNHYMLPLWFGEGLRSPRYGDVAIPKLIECMLAHGCRKSDIVAKIFGGGAVIACNNIGQSIGERNIDLACEMLECEGIPIVAKDVGGSHGRKVVFDTAIGDVYVRKVRSLNESLAGSV